MAALACLALSVNAMELKPTAVRNDTPFQVRIIVTRMVTCVGSDQSQAGPWIIQDILGPHQSGQLLLMSAHEELCGSYLQRLKIETAPRGGAVGPRNHPRPILLKDHFPNQTSLLRLKISSSGDRFSLSAYR